MTDKQVVYVVILQDNDYDDVDLLGVFTDKDKAQEVVREWYRDFFMLDEDEELSMEDISDSGINVLIKQTVYTRE